MYVVLRRAIVNGRMLVVDGGKTLRRIGRKEGNTLPQFWGEVGLKVNLVVISVKFRRLIRVFGVFLYNC